PKGTCDEGLGLANIGDPYPCEGDNDDGCEWSAYLCTGYIDGIVALWTNCAANDPSVISAFAAGGAYPTAAECAAPTPPVIPVASVPCPPQYQAFINNYGSYAAATGLSEANVLALASIESGWGAGPFAMG